MTGGLRNLFITPIVETTGNLFTHYDSRSKRATQASCSGVKSGSEVITSCSQFGLLVV